MQRPVINVAFGIDQSYIPQLRVVMRSIETRNERNPLRFFVFHDGIDAASRAQVSTRRATIEWIQICDPVLLGFDAHRPSMSRATYFRLMIPRFMPPDVSRAIYLDSDLILQSDIAELWDFDLGAHALGAVVDAGLNPRDFAARYALPAQGRYFNAGVLLLDVQKLRADQSFDHTIALLASNVYDYDDQDALNISFWNRWTSIPPDWNFQRNFLYEKFATWTALTRSAPRPKIIHFTDATKPWRRDEWHPLAWLYLKELRGAEFGLSLLRNAGIGFKTRLKWRLRWLLWNFRCFCRWNLGLQ
ncbi:glycosyltransferase family 8 protein [Methylobacterium fujisawaense]|uniref:glycosyltransferase family 8 protein n=1 Tax=Methylobacterium fujisawaense TaxID=107400 RepID=UPI00313E801B